jgi:hypothetical protein
MNMIRRIEIEMRAYKQEQIQRIRESQEETIKIWKKKINWVTCPNDQIKELPKFNGK